MIMNYYLALACFVLGLLIGSSSLADEPESTHSRLSAWNNTITPYLWSTGTHGFLKINDHRANLDDSFNNFEHPLNLGEGIHAEFRKTPWSLMLDPAYAHTTQLIYSDNIRAKATMKSIIIDGGAYYEIMSKAARRKDSKVSLELFGGGRIMSLDSTIYYYQQNPTQTDTSGFIVPLLGARFQYHFNHRLQSWINGDFGGFQINHVATTWSAMAGINYDMTQKYGLTLAYRALGVHYYRKVATVNTIVHGLMLGVRIAA